MKSSCRLCGNTIEKPFLSLGNSPISNAYLSKDDLNKMEPYYPLELFVCSDCYLVQIEEFELHHNIFNANYAYFSSYSESWLRHCEDYVKMMINRFGFDQNSFVVEVASNDGYLLQYFKERGIPVLGIEPTLNTAQVAIQKGISTDVEFFSAEYANNMKSNSKSADLIIGNNVLAHNPKLNDFVEGLRIALNENGIVTMEFPHLMKLIEKNEFDTIYHEHYSYFSFHTVQKLFGRHGMTIFDVDELSTHGGSLRIYAKQNGCNAYEVSEKVNQLLKKEEQFGLKDLKTYLDFAGNVEKIKRDLLKFLIEAKENNKIVVGYGAPAKGNTLLNYCGIRSDLIDYTVDISPHKQDLYLPGVHIPIYHPDKIKETKPDYVLILPWNIKEEILVQMRHIKGWDGKFVIAIPNLQVI
jgi:hypothetical protein